MKKIISAIITAALLMAGSTQHTDAQTTRTIKKGYAGNVGIGILAKEYPYGSISTTHGYNFGNGWFIGGGAAFQSGLYPRMFNYPVPAEYADGKEIVNTEGPNSEQFEGGFLLRGYLDVRYAFKSGRVTPFVDIKTGMTYDLAIEAPGGFIQPAAGISYRRFAFSAGLDMHLGQAQSGCLIRPDLKFIPYIGIAVNF